MTTPDIAAVMAQAMDQEDLRRELASASPGCGAFLELPDNPVGPGVGKAGLLPAVGEGHSVTAEVSPSVRKSFGPPRPEYADPLVGGVDYRPADVMTALRAAAEWAFTRQDAVSAGDVLEVVSAGPAPRRGLLGRLLGRGRRRSR